MQDNRSYLAFDFAACNRISIAEIQGQELSGISCGDFAPKAKTT